MVKRVVRGEGKTIKVERSPKLAPKIVAGAREATGTQLRVLAEETRQIIVDRAFAGAPQAPGRIVLGAPGWFRRRDIPGVDRKALRYKKLSLAHVLRKRVLGLDGRIFIASGDYLKNIEVLPGVRSRSGIQGYIVRMKPRAHKSVFGSSKILLSLLARVLEFGSRRWKIAPRPHWRPAAQAMQTRFKRLPRDIRAAALRAALRRVA
jgi:hypothetical protein